MAIVDMRAPAIAQGEVLLRARDLTKSYAGPDRELPVLAHVDEVKLLPAVEARLHGRDVTLLDPRLRVSHQRKESRAMLHLRQISTARSPRIDTGGAAFYKGHSCPRNGITTKC